MTLLLKLGAFLKPYIPHFVSAFLIISLFMWYSNHQFNAGEKAAEERFNDLQNVAKENREALEVYIAQEHGNITNETKEVLSGLGVRQTELKTTIIREIEREPRLSDPELGLSEGLLSAVNKARQETHQND